MSSIPQPVFPNTLDLGGVLYLRAVAPADAEAVYAVVEANRERLARWLPWVDNTRGAGDIRTFFEMVAGERTRGVQAAYLIWSGERVAGSIGITELDAVNSACMIGYYIAAELEGRGYITRACAALLAWAVEEAKLERVVIRCAVGNSRSSAIPRRLGFTLEGIARHAQRLHGGFADLEIYSLLSAEWLARPR